MAWRGEKGKDLILKLTDQSPDTQPSFWKQHQHLLHANTVWWGIFMGLDRDGGNVLPVDRHPHCHLEWAIVCPNT